jgi:mannose-6-phosphate isomerase
MPATRLAQRPIERVWGRRRLPPGFDAGPAGHSIGEIWFNGEADEETELLVKYLFTSGRLSVQVHPDDAKARARGHRRGKDEAWLVLEAEPRAVIGIGLTHPVTAGELRAAALDGSIEELLDWKPVKTGDFF